MIQIVLVSHADLGEALVRATEMIAGPTGGLYAVSLLPEESPESFRIKLEAILHELEGHEFLILIDLFGGTPYNVAARYAVHDHVACITGANLPMLLELVMAREGATLPELAEMIAQTGVDSVKNLGPMLRR
jgi:mannose/fructose/sorbose-specific phosphotransferase system IIA component